MATISKQQSIAMVGDDRYTGWGETEAKADMAAHPSSSSNSSSQTGIAYPASPAETFNWDDATNKALADLAPYYQKLLDMYNGDIALAKQQMDKDYERGLRVESEKTATGIADTEAQKAERDRKFKIALNDLDQTMNTRGIAGSGINTTETNKATADEAYQQSLLNNQERDLKTGLQYYKENADNAQNDQLQKWGMAPVSSADNPTGQYAPADANLVTPGYDINSYTSEPVQKQAALEKQKQIDAQNKAMQDYNLAMQKWQSSINQIKSVS